MSFCEWDTLIEFYMVMYFLVSNLTWYPDTCIFFVLAYVFGKCLVIRIMIMFFVFVDVQVSVDISGMFLHLSLSFLNPLEPCVLGIGFQA